MNSFHCKKCDSIIEDNINSDKNYSLICPKCNSWITNVRIFEGNKEYFQTLEDFFNTKYKGLFVKSLTKIVFGRLNPGYYIKDKNNNKVYNIYKSSTSDRFMNKLGYYVLHYEYIPNKYILLNKI